MCSQHFTEDSFEYSSDTVERYKVPKLKRDEIGITAVPSLLAKVTSLENERSLRIQPQRGNLVLLSDVFHTS